MARMAGRIFMEFGKDIMSLEITSNSDFLISYSQQYQLDGCLKSSGGTMMMRLPIVSLFANNVLSIASNGVKTPTIRRHLQHQGLISIDGYSPVTTPLNVDAVKNYTFLVQVTLSPFYLKADNTAKPVSELNCRFL
jgi:hypothetical protein